MTTTFKLCNCNRSMPIDGVAGEKIGTVLGTASLPVATELCRHDVTSYLEALDGVDDVIIGCTQERALFTELAQQKGSVAPLRFVNLRETGGWGAGGKQALPKMAALLAAAALPDPEPVPVVDYHSEGHVLIVGPADRALPWARRLQDQLEVSVLLTGQTHAEMPVERTFPVFSGEQAEIAGWLGAFTAEWRQDNPIDLEVCTRCNACVAACPEQAIGLDYQIDMAKCRSHHDCVKACGAIGAIDFSRGDTRRSTTSDLVFDLSDTPLLDMHQKPQGYFAPGTDVQKQIDESLKLTQMVGEFSKPKFFLYKEKLCAHGRNGQIGCTACIDVCSAVAVSHDGNRIKVNPNLCVGCGACTTECPSGALTYAYPRATDIGLRIQTMLAVYARAGGAQPMLLIHDQENGAALINRLGRAAQAGVQVDGGLSGVPARILPIAVHHTASTGIDVWLAAVAYGAAHIAILTTGSEAPQYMAALKRQMEVAQIILNGMGYAGSHFSLIEAMTPKALDVALAALHPAQVPAKTALFHVAAEKRTTLGLAIDHLKSEAPAAPEEIILPAGAPFGEIQVNRQACTLCMSCVGACPEAALADNPDLPQLRFIETNCVQCGLCETTCPEDAITLKPRLLLTSAAKQPAVLNEAQPFHCISCGKPFGTAQMIANMVTKLSQHGAFSGNTDRLKMCSDCRVVDMMANRQESTIADLKRH